LLFYNLKTVFIAIYNVFVYEIRRIYQMIFKAFLKSLYIVLFFLLLIYSHVCTWFGSFSPCPLLSPLPRYLPHFHAEPILPLSLILLKRRHVWIENKHLKYFGKENDITWFTR
jgi:hypothetical protein